MSLNISENKFRFLFDAYSKTVYALSLALTKEKRKTGTITRRVFSELASKFENYQDDVKFGIFANAAKKGQAVLNGEEIPSDWTVVWENSTDDSKEKSEKDLFAEQFPETSNFDVKQRQVLVLSMENFSIDDISEITEIPPQTVEWLISQNKKELKVQGLNYKKYLQDMKEKIPELSDIKEKLVEKYKDGFCEDKKKSKSGLIIGIIIGIAVVLCAVIFALFKFNIL
jgi:hypothetical protein